MFHVVRSEEVTRFKTSSFLDQFIAPSPSKYVMDIAMTKAWYPQGAAPVGRKFNFDHEAAKIKRQRKEEELRNDMKRHKC